MRIRLILTFVLLAAALGNSPAHAFGKELEERKWLEASTDNFKIYSQLSKKETLKLVRHLEIFRQVAAIFTGVGLASSPVPTVIYAVPSGKAARELSIDSRYAGFFRTGLRRNLIVVRDHPGTNEVATIMHEYVHYLTGSFGKYVYPMWFEEGFAEYLSSMEVRADEIIVGGVPPERHSSFRTHRWINMREIVSRRSGDDWTAQRSWMFYSEAWALVHFLMNRTEEELRFNDQLEAYIQKLDAGGDSIASFETAFGISIEDLDREVQIYLSGSRIPGIVLSADSIAPELEPDVTQVSREAISLELGNFALAAGDYERAERWYRIASNEPDLEAKAQAGLGDTMKFRDRVDEALPYFERALELAPRDPYCQLDMAEFWDYRARNVEEPALRDEYFDLARSYYAEALELNPSLPEVYAMYGRSYLLEGENYEEAVDMLEEARRLLRSNNQIKLWLAGAYLGAGRNQDAAVAARSVLSWSHEESEASTQAQKILDETGATD